MAKLGSTKKPARARVQTFERAEEIMIMCEKNNWKDIVGIETDKDEDISEVEYLLNP